ncbi:MAG: ParA family protein [Chlamydiota bacterium]|nr:ParA family protein [Chlamydiota bacterium]
MNIIGFASAKGGVGKTTFTVNIGAGLTIRGHRVLLIDFDPKEQVFVALGIKTKQASPHLFDLFEGHNTIQDLIVEKDGINIISLSCSMPQGLYQMSFEDLQKNIERTVLSVLQNYDYVLVDIPAATHVSSQLACSFVHEIYSPIKMEFLDFMTIDGFRAFLHRVHENYNHTIALGGFIVNFFDSRKNLHHTLLHQIEKEYDVKVFSAFIRDNIALAEAPKYGQSIFDYKGASFGAQDVMSLCIEIEEKHSR